MKLYKLTIRQYISTDDFQQVCWNKQTKSHQSCLKQPYLNSQLLKTKKKTTLGIERCWSWRSRGAEQQPDTKQRPVGP